METGTYIIISRLKELAERLTPRRDTFRYLHSVRTENPGRAQLAGSGWRGLVPRAKSLRREFAALLKALD